MSQGGGCKCRQRPSLFPPLLVSASGIPPPGVGAVEPLTCMWWALPPFFSSLSILFHGAFTVSHCTFRIGWLTDCTMVGDVASIAFFVEAFVWLTWTLADPKKGVLLKILITFVQCSCFILWRHDYHHVIYVLCLSVCIMPRPGEELLKRKL